ncbi:hypothetical protein ACOSP7_028441 [Xanthoceras sorbifolium]
MPWMIAKALALHREEKVKPSYSSSDHLTFPVADHRTNPYYLIFVIQSRIGVKFEVARIRRFPARCRITREGRGLHINSL